MPLALNKLPSMVYTSELLLSFTLVTYLTLHQCSNAFFIPSTSRKAVRKLTVPCPKDECHRHFEFDSSLFSSSSSSSSDVQIPPPLSSSPLDNDSPTSPYASNNRGRVNEIDFCMAPSDVSLSRYYNNDSEKKKNTDLASEGNFQSISLTRALNNASNRAIRRILLSRSWPSAEALNLSLAQYLSESSKETEQTNETKENNNENSSNTVDTIKCPVPRPILNIMMRRRGDMNSIDNKSDVADAINPAQIIKPKNGRSDKEYVNDQINAFYQSYGDVPGYQLAEAYLECILSLATTGIESPKVYEVLDGAVYDESYRRFISVLKSVGTVFEDISEKDTNNWISKDDDDNESKTAATVATNRIPLQKICSKLVDQDICLSMLDKIAINKEKQLELLQETSSETLNAESSKEKDVSVEENIKNIDNTNDESLKNDTDIGASDVNKNMEKEDEMDEQDEEKRFKFPFFFMSRKKSSSKSTNNTTTDIPTNDTLTSSDKVDEEVEETQIEPSDLGGVLLSAEEPTMTRQLNVLSNIVQRALLFGGDQELLVLSETLEADKPAFINRWYPNERTVNTNIENAMNNDQEEKRPGVQFLNCLVQLMKECYANGIVVDLEPPFPLTQSYANAYERLLASLVELGSGYIKPMNRKRDIILGTIPKTPKEEFGRFAEWEVNIRQTLPDVSAYPDDLVGEWQVQDEIGGKPIGISKIELASEGEVVAKPPITGLRWRLDPGPTHLDTCTFQCMSDDGDIFQYKGFIDRGARLESRFSKRPIKIRGAVTFQMRDGEAAYMSKAYKKDMLPIDLKTGATRFVMTKSVDTNND